MRQDGLAVVTTEVVGPTFQQYIKAHTSVYCLQSVKGFVESLRNNAALSETRRPLFTQSLRCWISCHDFTLATTGAGTLAQLVQALSLSVESRA